MHSNYTKLEKEIEASGKIEDQGKKELESAIEDFKKGWTTE